jgi:U6 snRNA-associated Sm-like protein LSm2
LHRSFFKTLTNHVVTVELKNDIRIRGTLKSVDQYLNIKLDDVDVLDLDKYPHLSSVKNMFIRGSVVRYVVLPQAEVDRGLLEDATRRGRFFSFSISYSYYVISNVFLFFFNRGRKPS